MSSPLPLLMSAEVCFIVPTLKRPRFLSQCLSSLTAQTLQPRRVLVGIRPDDAESLALVERQASDLHVQAVEARGVGVVGSMSSCLEATKEEFVALVDDDVELPPHWLETMLRHLKCHPDVLGVSGRDLLQDHPAMRREEKRLMNVGRLHWYGRITGNHHRGAGAPRRVHILRGSNCLFRGDFLREVGFEAELRGKGAQVNWELALGFQAMKRGKTFFYDPGMEVIHHVAPRADADSLHRGGWNAAATSDCAFNETLVVKKHLRGVRRITSLGYQALVGSSMVPGLAHALRQWWRRDPLASSRVLATLSGRLDALRHGGSSPAVGD